MQHDNMVSLVFAAARLRSDNEAEAQRLATLTVMAIAQDAPAHREQIIDATVRHLQTLRVQKCR